MLNIVGLRDQAENRLFLQPRSFSTLAAPLSTPFSSSHVPSLLVYLSHPCDPSIVHRRDIEGVRRLISEGANIEGLLPGNPQPNDYGTPLHIAAMYCPEAIDMLLEAGGDPMAVRPADGFNTLMVAAQCNNLQSAKKVLSKNKDLFFGKAGFFGYTFPNTDPAPLTLASPSMAPHPPLLAPPWGDDDAMRQPLPAAYFIEY